MKWQIEVSSMYPTGIRLSLLYNLITLHNVEINFAFFRHDLHAISMEMVEVRAVNADLK